MVVITYENPIKTHFMSTFSAQKIIKKIFIIIDKTNNYVIQYKYN